MHNSLSKEFRRPFFICCAYPCADSHPASDSRLARSQSLAQTAPALPVRPGQGAFGQDAAVGASMTSLTRKLSTCSQPPMHLQAAFQQSGGKTFSEANQSYDLELQGLPDFSWFMIPKPDKMYQMVIKYSRCP
jgi:hypothetical protein